MTRLAVLILAFALSGCGSLVPEGRAPARPQAQAPRPVAVSGEQRQCLADLGARGANVSPVADRYYGAGCSTLSTVNLSAVHGDVGEFRLTNLGPVSCRLAETTAAWARFGVDRAARQVLGSPLARIETLGSYSCRDVAGSGRRSAHATANAIDISAFVLADGRRISVLGDWSGGDAATQRFLRLVHLSACKRFGTVLGPDYNAAHKDHFHVESGRQGGFCR
ncbi:extensin family protein [Altererythrobacter sp. TH136]|uniref:extensin-like domain-containing protein n=1 Tax=Altererythrobacter sp. TH136 TaxID=2067415 RepID=UPI001163EB92|nr:extensin family protein [Altererythrobacter sp. TH136]QDM39692.1 extensin family protein [Altererythrobacter sp. TH136]